MHYPTDRIAHTTVFVTPVVEHWLEREIAQWCVNKHKPTDTVFVYLHSNLNIFGIGSSLEKTMVCEQSGCGAM